MKKTTFFKALIPAGLIAGFGLILGLGIGGGIPDIFASHGGPLNWVEGLHDEGVALSGTERPVLMSGDDGTNLQNLLVDSGGRLQIDLVAAVVDLGTTDNAVLDTIADGITAEVPSTIGHFESGVVNMLDGSAETDVVDTNMMASAAITITGPGRIVNVCFFSSADTVHAVAGTLFFFDADPDIAVNTADMTIAEAQSVVAKVNVVAGDYETDFATTATACVEVNQAYHSISHVVYHNGGGVTWDNDDLDINVFFERTNT